MIEPIELPPPVVLEEFVHGEVLHQPSDRFTSLHVRAVLDAGGDGVQIADFKLSAAEARDVAASLLLAADVIDPHYRERLI